VTRVNVESALQMEAAVEKALPADVAVMVAAVADWRVENAGDPRARSRRMARASLRR
jgi:phosphopantothenoylcysteine decarboxylase/phosphopantothenate--cysteine ligase